MFCFAEDQYVLYVNMYKKETQLKLKRRCGCLFHWRCIILVRGKTTCNRHTCIYLIQGHFFYQIWKGADLDPQCLEPVLNIPYINLRVFCPTWILSYLMFSLSLNFLLGLCQKKSQFRFNLDKYFSKLQTGHLEFPVKDTLK